jgi:hypothetical protein
MAQALLVAPSNVNVVVSNTPSGTTYSVGPGTTIVANSLDVRFLESLGFVPGALSIGSGLSLANNGSVSVAAGVGEWTAGAVTAVGSSIQLNGGTIDVAAIASDTLFGNAGTGSAIPSAIAIDTSLSLSASGTLALAALSASSILGNAGTVGAIPQAIAIGSNLSLSPAGTLSLQNAPTIIANNVTQMVVNANTSTPSNLPGGALLSLVGADGGNVGLGLSSFNTLSRITALRANGTEAAPTAIKNTNTIFNFRVQGYQGTAYAAASALFSMVASEDFTPTANGTQIVLGTIKNGTTIVSNSLTLTNDATLVAQNLSAVLGLSAPGGTTGAIGGSALTAGQKATGTVAITNVTTAMAVFVTPQIYPGDGFSWEGYVSSAGTVTVNVICNVVGTPVATPYNVRFIQ